MGGGEKRSANGVSRKYSCRTEGADPSWANAVIMLMAKDRLKRPAVVNLRRPAKYVFRCLRRRPRRCVLPHPKEPHRRAALPSSSDIEKVRSRCGVGVGGRGYVLLGNAGCFRRSHQPPLACRTCSTASWRLVLWLELPLRRVRPGSTLPGACASARSHATQCHLVLVGGEARPSATPSCAPAQTLFHLSPPRPFRSSPHACRFLPLTAAGGQECSSAAACCR